jgi:hypothetical protein
MERVKGTVSFFCVGPRISPMLNTLCSHPHHWASYYQTQLSWLTAATHPSPFTKEKNSLSPKHHILLEQMTEAVQKPSNPMYTQNKTKIHQSNTTLFQKEYHL